MAMNGTIYVGLNVNPEDDSPDDSSTGTYSSLAITSAASSLINSPSTASGMVNIPFQFTITSTISPAIYSATNLPPGLALNAATGVISGTPTAPGTYSVTVGMANGVASGSAILTITITQFLQALPYTALLGTPDLYLSSYLNFTGAQPTGAVTFAVDNAVPAGTPCSPTSQAGQLGCGITWPGAGLGLGTHIITVSFAGDANYPAQTSAAILTINAPGNTLQITVPPNTGTVGAPTTLLTFSGTFTGPVPTGTVGVLVDNQNPLNVSCSLTGAQSATCQWAYPTGSLAAGKHTITAFFLSDGVYPTTAADGTLTLQ